MRATGLDLRHAVTARMGKPARVVKAVFRGLVRAYETFEVDIGPIQARGIPAILIGVTGIVLASGVAAMLSRAAERLPETLREARGLSDSIRGTRPPLNP